MTNIQLLNGLLSFGACAVVLALVYGPLQSFIVDAVRQRFFELRDGVFDAAARGEVEFTDPAYLRFRNHLNRLLRDTHEITVWRFLALSQAAIRMEVSPSRDELSPFRCAPQVIQDAHKRVLIWMTVLLWLRSPLLIGLSAVAVVFVPVFLIIAATSASARDLPTRVFACLRAVIFKDAALEVILH
jgi:hypothetical protein